MSFVENNPPPGKANKDVVQGLIANEDLDPTAGEVCYFYHLECYLSRSIGFYVFFLLFLRRAAFGEILCRAEVWPRVCSRRSTSSATKAIGADFGHISSPPLYLLCQLFTLRSTLTLPSHGERVSSVMSKTLLELGGSKR